MAENITAEQDLEMDLRTMDQAIRDLGKLHEKVNTCATYAIQEALEQGIRIGTKLVAEHLTVVEAAQNLRHEMRMRRDPVARDGQTQREQALAEAVDALEDTQSDLETEIMEMSKT